MLMHTMTMKHPTPHTLPTNTTTRHTATATASAAASLLLLALALVVFALPVGLLQAGDDDAAKAKKLAEYKATFEQQKSLPPTSRVALLSSIGSLGTPGAAEFLATIFQNTSEERYVRRTALSNCGRCKDPAQMDAISKFATDADAYVAAGAIEGLGNYGKDAPLAPIEAAAQSADSSLAYAGVNALIRLKPADLNERLMRLANGEPKIGVMAGASIVDEFARQKHPDTLKLIRKFLAEWDATQDAYRGRLINALKNYGVDADTIRIVLAEYTSESAGSSVKKYAIEALRGLKDGPALDVLIGELGSKDAKVRAAVAEALGGINLPKVVDAVVKALEDEKDSDAKMMLVETLVSLGPDACDKAFEQLLDLADDKSPAVSLPAIYALGFCAGHNTDRKLLQKLEKAAKNRRDANEQSEALIALGRLRTEGAFALIADGMKSRDWHVVSAAVMALRQLRDIRGIDLLIEALAKAEGRLRGDIVIGLEDLTGKALPDDQQVWRTWWRANRDGFMMPPPMEERDENPNRQAGSTGFYGIEVRSLRVAFVLDVSGSMSGLSKFVPTGPNAPKANPTKLDVAKQQLLQVLDQFAKMDAKVKFNITFFHTNPEPWKESLVETSKANLADARAYVEKQTPRGGTNIFDSLEQAMQDPEVDTIFLLSDGAPGSGKFVAADDICREIAKINRTRRIVINCIGIEVAGSAEQFLKRLARESGGQYARR
ncbi:MAG: HEAT repeat domain-containing protein [Planctomycetota bacterium]